jgi:hypothetical protein
MKPSEFRGLLLLCVFSIAVGLELICQAHVVLWQGVTGGWGLTGFCGGNLTDRNGVLWDRECGRALFDNPSFAKRRQRVGYPVWGYLVLRPGLFLLGYRYVEGPGFNRAAVLHLDEDAVAAGGRKAVRKLDRVGEWLVVAHVHVVQVHAGH